MPIINGEEKDRRRRRGGIEDRNRGKKSKDPIKKGGGRGNNAYLAFRLSRSKKIFNLSLPPLPPVRARVLADRSEIAKNKEGTRRGIAEAAALPGQQTYIYTVVQKKRVRVRSSLLIFCRT